MDKIYLKRANKIREDIFGLLDSCQPNLNERVFVKGNMYCCPWEKSVSTSPEVMNSVVDWLLEKGHTVKYGDIVPIKNSAITNYSNGISRKDLMINLNKESNLTNLILDENLSVRIPSFLLEYDILNVPVMKTHAETLLSCACKNLMGLLPKTKDRENIHKKGLDHYIGLLYKGMEGRVKCSVVDGIYSMEGNGPRYGKAVDTNILFAGNNLEAVDNFALTLIGSSRHPEYLEKKDYELITDILLDIKLKSPDALSSKYFTGKPSFGESGVFATMIDKITEIHGDKTNIVFREGDIKEEHVNIAVNNDAKGANFYVNGNSPSRRELRGLLGIVNSRGKNDG